MVQDTAIITIANQ